METGEIIFTPINVKEGYVFSAFYFVDSEYEEMVIVDPDDDANIIGIQGGLTCDIVIYVEIFAE